MSVSKELSSTSGSEIRGDEAARAEVHFYPLRRLIATSVVSGRGPASTVKFRVAVEADSAFDKHIYGRKNNA